MLDQVFASLPPKRCAKIERPASELAMLKDLREAVERTQEYLEARLGVGQETVSRIERRSDVLLSTLRRYVEAMGGELELIARFSQPRAASHRPPSCQSAYCNKAARGWKEIEIRGSSPVIWSTGEARCQWPRRKRKTVKKRRVPCNLDACVPRKKARALLVGATSVEN